MSRPLKLLSSLLAVAMTASIVLSGCGGETATDSVTTAPVQTTASTTETTAAEKLKEVSLKAYIISWSAPFADNSKVVGEISRLLKEKINATLNVTVDLSAEGDKKIPLMLASGEEYDLMTMSAGTYNSEVSKGGLMALDELLPEYMPDRMKDMSKLEIENLKFNGKYYKIPGGFDWFLPQGWIIRGDLREKYNIPEVKDVNGLKVYLETLKKNEPGVIPFNTSAGDVLNMWLNFINASGYMQVYLPLGMYYNYNSDKVTVQYEFELDQYKDFLTTTKEFTDKGYWSKNAYAAKTISLDAFKAGTSFVATGHVVTANDTAIILKNTHPDWKAEFVRIPDNYRQSPVKPGAGVIPKVSKNPDRMLMALELLRTDRQLNDLLEYGIKDAHYSLADSGKVISLPEGSTKYPIDQFPLAWGNRNMEFWRGAEGSLQTLMDIQKQAGEMSKMSKIYGFTFDKTPVATEVAAMSDIYNTYKPVFNLGAFDNVDAILKEYTDKMYAAGAEKVKAEMQKQVDAYYQKIQSMQ